MKRYALIAAAALAFGGPAYAHGDEHEHTPRHGGVVAEVKDMDYELVATPALLQLYLRDHGQPVDVARTQAKLTLLSGTQKQEVELKPAGDRLESTGSFQVGAGAKVVAVVHHGGKVSTARFSLK